jgi:beta-lactamase class A
MLLFLIIGLGLGYFWSYRQEEKQQQNFLSGVKSIRESNNDYHFINPLLAYDFPESKDFGEYKDLNQKLTSLIDSAKNKHQADEVSIYFRGNQGHWVGIDDNTAYYPASLLKVVVMIAYFQQAETSPEILNKKLQYTQGIKNEVTSSEFDVPSSLKLNESYTVSDLIQDMIVNSDNGATFTLVDSLDGKALDEVYTDFGLQGPTDSGDYQISAKNYSLFFRILFNATYLNREYSEKALDLLSQTTFKDGLAAGLPSGTVVAHKFGEHVLSNNNGSQSGVELHDCGLIYGKHNFLLCVMTRGQKVEDLEGVIKSITAEVYKDTNNIN